MWESKWFHHNFSRLYGCGQSNILTNRGNQFFSLIFITLYKITESNGGILFRNLLLSKNTQWKNGKSLMLKKLDFFREIHNSVAPSIMEIDKIFTDMWCVLGNHGLGWKSKLFSRAKSVKKSEKAHCLELQVRQVIYWTLYKLRTSGLACLTRYNQYLTILHYPWLRVKSKQVKKLIFFNSKFNKLFLRPYLS